MSGNPPKKDFVVELLARPQLTDGDRIAELLGKLVVQRHGGLPVDHHLDL